MTGPFNPHFVRDVGAAVLVAGGEIAAIYIVRNPDKLRSVPV
jgi:hypothetical protein